MFLDNSFSTETHLCPKVMKKDRNCAIISATAKSKCKEAIENYIRASFTKYTRMLPADFEFGSEEHNSLAEQLQDTNLSVEIFENLDDSMISRLADLWTKMKADPNLPLCQKDTDYFFMEKLQLCLQVSIYTPNNANILDPAWRIILHWKQNCSN